jgi:Protein of unknown function (DUF4199)
MKNIILKFGLISGGIATVLFICTMVLYKTIGFEKFAASDNSVILGYATMVVSMSVIYFAIKTFRDEQNNGSITFLKALLIGLGVMLISCIIYSLAWLVIYYNFFPTFMDDYSKACIQKAQNSSATQAEMAKTVESMNQMKEWYKNPFLIFALTIMEPTPVGLLVSLVSALVLRKK